MKEPDSGIEPDTLRGAAAIMGEQRVEKGEKRVDRVKRRATRTAGKAHPRLVHTDHIVKDREIQIGCFTLVTTQGVHILAREIGAPCDGGKPVDHMPHLFRPAWTHLVGMVAQAPHQH